MATESKDLIKQLREMLDRLAMAGSLPKDEWEVVADEVAAKAKRLAREGIVEALDVAIGKNTRRREQAVYLLAEWAELAEVQERMGDWLHDRDPNWRSYLIQTVGLRKLRRFGSHLHHPIQHDPDDFCRDMAIHSAGKLRCAESLPAILRLAEADEPRMRFRLVETLSNYALPSCEPHLARWFRDESQEKSHRVFAAKGMAKLGHQEAVDYLIEMLDDPDLRTEKSFEPGEARRAAQSLCEVFGWPFERTSGCVDEVKNRLRGRDITPP